MYGGIRRRQKKHVLHAMKLFLQFNRTGNPPTGMFPVQNVMALH